jgi:hypothetical protein
MGHSAVSDGTYLVYNTVVRLCQCFCYGGKVKFVQIPYSQDHFSKISRTFFVKKLIPYKTYILDYHLFLALYGSTTIESRLFRKNIENFVWFLKQYLLCFFILEIQLANILDRGFLFLCNTLLLHIPLLALTDRRNYGETNTLATRGLEELFSSCAFVSVFCSCGK